MLLAMLSKVEALASLTEAMVKKQTRRHLL
jgi:hypothetical protein